MKTIIIILLMLVMSAGLFAQDFSGVRNDVPEKSVIQPTTGNYQWIQMPGWITHEQPIINFWISLPSRIFHF